MIYSLGIDVSEEDFEANLIRYKLEEQRHQKISHRKFGNRLSGFKALMSWLNRWTGEGPKSIRCTLEASGVYYEELALYILENEPQIHLSVVLPNKAREFMSSRGLRNKTDDIDAYGLALMGAERRLKAWEGIDPFWRELRTMTRTKTELQDQRTALTNRLHAQRHSGLPSARVQQSLERVIDQLNQEITRLEKQIEQQLTGSSEYAQQIRCLKSIDAIGIQTIASVLAETSGFTNFTRRAQVISFSGYDVRIRKSGKWKGKPKLSKQGSKYIRRAMYMPATTVVRLKRGPNWQLYQRLLTRHGVKMKAHVAVQKKLLGYMFYLWKKQEVYDPQKIIKLQAYHKNVAPFNNEATVDTSPALAQ